MLGHNSDNFGNTGIRAVATKEGLVIVFNKHALTALKAGKFGSVDLVSGGKKLHVKFMRDNTFKRLQYNENLAVMEQQQEIQDIAKELAQ